ncbi:ATP-binding cassette domain-containing protein [Palleronia caenipelagi]|uniref:ATP-binding cassette domain-containing protein n=1 Tax=Palleronia caenipelagi TaxID=2489174 RepID=A0A547Q9D9_9RHOB|nr:ATP-binding cassette domain-containing protein [Palleronia caenipelagi]TRD23007.1 ATP-binding cassette domain-containing protein [Palleronia caenipelagi]
MSAILPLRLSGAEARRRGKRLVGPVDLTLNSPGATVVIGPNGAGKTTLLRLMHGTERLAGGEISWARPLAEVRHEIAFVFQTPVVLRRSVLDNIAYPLRLRGQSRKNARAEALDWAGRVGLGGMPDRQATVLSGGERQKLALARALITRPEVLFLDEPTAALDGRSTREIETILTEASIAGTRLILSTHDMGQARRLATEVVFLLHGRVHETAAALAFFDAPGTPEAAAFLRGDIIE